MTAQVILNNESATLWYHPVEKIVHHQIHKFIFGDQFKELLLTGTETLRKNKSRKWLSDDRSNTVLRKEDLEWGNANWFPQTIQAGWKYWAIVQPEKVLAQIAMEKQVKMYAEVGIVAKFFTDTNEAMTWLINQK